MTKEEKIQEAYGKYWEESKRYVDLSDGTISNRDRNFDLNNCFFEIVKINAENKIRPKSLQGIDNNNGWIKIKSKKDLPKESDDYHICIENKDLSIAYFDKYDGWFIECPEITHYQPIIKPKLPIY